MKKLDYIDGLKGIGALMVFFCHFVFAFYYAAYSLTGDAVNTNSGIEITIGKTPLNLLYSGNSAVCFWCSAALCSACPIFTQGIKDG